MQIIRNTPGGKIALWAREPAESPRGAVVVLQEAFGVNDHIRDVVGRFAAAGYLAVAPDLYHRQERSILPYDEVAEAKAALAKVTEAQVVEDVRAAIDWLETERNVTRGSVAVVGYCFGGRAAFVAALHFHGLACAVSYYGGGIVSEDEHAPVRRASMAVCPILAIFGEDDAMIPPVDVAQIESALRDARSGHEVIVFPGAGHGFACDARPASFNAAAAAAAAEHTFAFLDRHVAAPRPS